jgi:hypothetical protein
MCPIQFQVITYSTSNFVLFLLYLHIIFKCFFHVLDDNFQFHSKIKTKAMELFEP